jgi:hypothetical protein
VAEPIVYVLPEPVCPKANTVALKPWKHAWTSDTPHSLNTVSCVHEHTEADVSVCMRVCVRESQRSTRVYLRRQWIKGSVKQKSLLAHKQLPSVDKLHAFLRRSLPLGR